MTPETPAVALPPNASPSDAPKRRLFSVLTSKPLLWTLALLAPPLAYISPIGFFLGEFLAGDALPTVKWELPFGLAVEASRETHNAVIQLVMGLATAVFWLAAPLGTVASVGAFRRSRRVWAKTLAALLIVANVLMLFFRPICVLLAEVFGVSFDFYL
ncbi:MAG: hypothetical protein IKW13_06720 [Thermoguttaceae bacterium]|nr:hypothetical protein [Thermoguttaceae bacterium]